MFFMKQKQSLPEADKALPGRPDAMAINNRHYVLKTPLLAPFPEECESAYFGMGCFWGAEKLFWSLRGVYTTAVGYGAGYTPNPTYEEVCSGLTAHNELVLVVFKPSEIRFDQLLKVFWESHNPTEGMRQGNDVGTQYRSGIYPTNATQLAQAQQSQQAYNRELSARDLPVSTTEIQPDITFYYAEDYHQQYLAKNPAGYCPNHTCTATGLPHYKTNA